MAREYKKSHKVYAAWNYKKEIEDLNKASEQGWQLIWGGCFSSKFKWNPDMRYRYQVDYRSVDDMARYIETFREQGWEYINSTFNGWHFFRKIYDPALPEESYEIFTDEQSLNEMTKRWSLIATVLAVIIGVLAAVMTVKTVLKPTLPAAIILLTVLIESIILFRGVYLMKRKQENGRRRLGTALTVAMFVAIFLGLGANIVLSNMRPYLRSTKATHSVTAPVENMQWNTFEVKYPDRYYLDLKITAPEPVTVEIVDNAGDVVYSITDAELDEEDICLKLKKGEYSIMMSCTSGYTVECTLE